MRDPKGELVSTIGKFTIYEHLEAFDVYKGEELLKSGFRYRSEAENYCADVSARELRNMML